MILCPAFLREKWYRELLNRFGIKSEIMDAKEVFKKLKNQGRDFGDKNFSIIASMQGLRPIKGWDDDDPKDKRAQNVLSRFLRDQGIDETLIDLLIIDEAHYLRMSDPKQAEKKTTTIGKLLREVTEHIVLLTATPIHLGNQDLYQLLNIVDEATFNKPDVFLEILEANAPLIKMRDLILKQEMKSEDFKLLLEIALDNDILKDNRQLKALLSDPPSDDDLKNKKFRSELAFRLETINLLGHAISRTRKRDVTEWKVIRDVRAEHITPTSIELNFYDKVTEVVRDFCIEYRQSEGFILATPQRQMASSIPAALREWQNRLNKKQQNDNDDLDLDDIDDDEKIGPVLKELISKVRILGNYEELKASDSKYKRLIETIKELRSENPLEKIVVFSYFRATLKYLAERLKEDGINCVLIMGGMEVSKDELIDSFRESDEINVMLTSEVSSEGIDLQFSRVLVNYDLPWNPMRVEQRIGRIDRLGQKSKKVLIWNLFYEDTIDSRIYKRLFERLKIFEHALGDIEPVLGEKIQKLTSELLTGKLTPTQEIERIEQTAVAIENIRKEEEILENEAYSLVAYGDYILNQVKAAKELNRWINGKDIQIYIMDFMKLHYPGCEFVQLQNEELVFSILLTPEAKSDLLTFIQEAKINSTTALTRNSSSPVKCLFANKLFQAKEIRLETINQLHPLVRFINNEVNKQEFKYKPAVAVKLNHSVFETEVKKGFYVFTIQLWNISGIQDQERLSYCCVDYNDRNNILESELTELIISEAAKLGEDWLEWKSYVDIDKIFDIANNVCLTYSEMNFEEYKNNMSMQNDDRADLQTKTLELHLNNQLRKYEITKQTLIEKGKLSHAKGWETKMNTLRNSVEMQRIKIRKKSELHTNNIEICVGILNIY